MKKSHIIPLLNFESFIEDDVLLHAESLFDIGNLSDISNHGKGKWRGKVQDDVLYNVGATLYEGSIQESTCTCERNFKGSPCSHVVCLFFGVRQKDLVKTPLKAINPVRKKRSADYLKSILRTIDAKELRTFISSYAVKDKTFKLLLTTHFSRQIQDQNGFQLYERILDECFPVKTQNSKNSYVAEARLLLRIAKEMLSNYKDSLSLESYTEAFQMIQTLNQKVAYALFINTKENKSLTELQKQTHAAYRLILNDRMAPALKHEIVNAMIQSIGKSFYRYKGANNLYDLVLIAQPTFEQFELFRNTLLEKIDRSPDLTDQAFLLSYFIHAIFKSNSISLHAELIELFEGEQVLLVETIRKMLDLGFYREAEKALDFYHEKERLDELTFYRFQLRFQLSHGDPQEAIDTAQKLYQISLDRKNLDTLKKISGDSWPERYQKILQFFTQSGREDHFHQALQLAEREKDPEMLLQLLSQKPELAHYLKYDKSLAASHPQQLYDFYRNHIFEYLHEHAGEKAARKVMDILHHLNLIGLSGITSKLEKEILNQYPERKTIKAFIRSVRV